MPFANHRFSITQPSQAVVQIPPTDIPLRSYCPTNLPPKITSANPFPLKQPKCV